MTDTGRRFLIGLVVICVAALAIRVTYVVGEKRHERPLGDQIYYNAQANVLAAGEGFLEPGAWVKGEREPSAQHPPLTAIVLAPVGWFTDEGRNLQGGAFPRRLLMALIGTFVVALIGLIGRSVAGNRAGLIAAALAAISPSLWANDGLLMSETLAALTVAGLVLLLVRYANRPSTALVLGIGVVLGLATLVRAELLLFLPFVVAPVLLSGRAGPWRERLARLGIATAIAAAVALLWVGPNLFRFERPVVFSTNDGMTVCGANNARTYSGSGLGLWAFDCAFVKLPPGDASVQSEALRTRGVDYARDHAGSLPKVAAVRVLRTWGFWDPSGTAAYNKEEGRERWVSWAAYAAWWITLPLAVVGAVLLHRRRVSLVPLLGPAIVVTVVSLLIYGLPRFRVPADVTALVLAAVALDAWWATRRRQEAPA